MLRWQVAKRNNMQTTLFNLNKFVKQIRLSRVVSYFRALQHNTGLHLFCIPCRKAALHPLVFQCSAEMNSACAILRRCCGSEFTAHKRRRSESRFSAALRGPVLAVLRKSDFATLSHDGLTGRQNRWPVHFIYKVHKSSKPQ